MTATPPSAIGHPAEPELLIVGVAWQAAAAVMAPFAAPRSTACTAVALLEAALGDADRLLPSTPPTITPHSAARPRDSLPLEHGPLKIFTSGNADTATNLRATLGDRVEVAEYGTLAQAALAAARYLQAGTDTSCVLGAIGQPEQASGAWLVLESVPSARARGAAAYAAVVTAALAVPTAVSPAPASPIAIGWLELPAGQSAAPAAKQLFALTDAVLAGALRSAALAGAEEKGVQDALALARAALALGHKILPLSRLPDAGQAAAGAAPRPWIHPLPLPGWPASTALRRAGWLATAGPGQPTYLLLQEDPAAPVRPDAVPFSQELLCLGADSPTALGVQVAALRRQLDFHPPDGTAPDLARLAYQTVTELPSQPACRLAVVTSSLAELGHQLDEIAAQLPPQTQADGPRLHRPGSGIYYGSALRGPDAGATAFLFPGLGASYPHMLGDLCLHFPAVREVFDNIDFVAAELGEPMVPSQQVFPWPGEERQESVTGAAVITLLMAEWALAELLRQLGIAPDTLMGCSTGEFAALCQGGSIDAVTALPIFYRLSLGVERGLPAEQLANLQTVLVAAAAQTLTPLLDTAPGPLYLSADLGPDCALLVGQRAAVSWLLAAL